MDNEPFTIGGFSIVEIVLCIYIGATIKNSKVAAQIESDMNLKMRHGRKFYSFVSAHRDAPFTVKKTVWDAAVISAITYASESWWTTDLKPAVSLYMSTLKRLLGVRTQTPNDLCLMELDLPSMPALVTKRQREFFCRMANRDDYNLLHLREL